MRMDTSLDHEEPSFFFSFVKLPQGKTVEITVDLNHLVPLPSMVHVDTLTGICDTESSTFH